MSPVPAAAQEPADRVFLNGRVFTADDVQPAAEGLAVRGDRLAAVGSSEEVRRLAGPKTEVVDLRGRFVSPGFIDAHLHFLVIDAVELGGATEVAELQRRIGAFARSHPEKAWVTGRGWAYSAFPGGLPERTQLDAVVPDRPAFMTGYDGHTGWANTQALRAAGITRETQDPQGGVIVRDARGEPTGALKESAMRLVRELIPPASEAELYAALRRRLDQAASYGLTSVQQASFPEAELPVYERVLREGGLKLRFYWAVPFKKSPTDAELERYEALRARHRGPQLKFGAAKGLLDGVVESGTAAMFEPWADGAPVSEPLWTQAELDRSAALYDARGFQIMLHAIGDRAISMALDAYARAARVNGTNGRRHRIEHVEVPRFEDLSRFKALGVIASTQALFALPDQNTLEAYAPKLGPARAARAMPFKTIDDLGVVQAFGSDWPVFSMETLTGIHCAVTRKTPQGTPAGGWYPEQRLSVEAALRHFTRDAAYASFDEELKGTLTAGKLADFVVLSEDIRQPPAERILRAKVLLTVMGGRDTHRDPAF